MSDFKITDKSGIKLKTANKYVTEDLGVTLTDNDINNIVAGNIKKDVSILGVTGTLDSLPAGVLVNGTEITIDTDQYTAVIAGQDGDDQTGKVVISGLEIPVELDQNKDSSVKVTNLTPANVKKNITILGVVGTFEGNPKPEQSKTVEFNPGSANNITVTPDAGYALSSVQVNKPATMIPSNIKSGVDIGGVVGTYEGSSTITYWDGTYIEQNVFNVAINVETYENSVRSAGVFYSIDNGGTFVKIETQTTININSLPYIMFKYVGYSGGGVPGPGSYCHVGTTSGGTDIINANDAEYHSTITTENIELTKDTTFYVNMVHN